MHPEKYLRLIKKLNVLIDNEILEKEQLFTLATKTTQENDDMPHASGTSDKVGNISVKLLQQQQKIDHITDVFVDLRDEIKAQIRTLPVSECDVLYKFYVLNMTLSDIAEKRDQSVDWVKNLKNRGVYQIKVIESDTYKEACKILNINA